MHAHQPCARMLLTCMMELQVASLAAAWVARMRWACKTIVAASAWPRAPAISSGVALKPTAAGGADCCSSAADVGTAAAATMDAI
jgi:hypothetical protein